MTTAFPARQRDQVGGAACAEQPSRVHRIAVCLDGSALGDRVIPHAAALARAMHASLTLLQVLEPPQDSSVSDPMEWEIRRTEARHHLRRLAAEQSGADAVFEAELVEGQPAEQICHWAEHHDVDVAVLSSHGASGQTEWTLASTARKLVEGVPCSFLLVPAVAPSAGPVAHYRRVLVPLDGSPRAESVLGLAAKVAVSEGAELLLVHVVPVPELTEIGPLDREDIELRERLVQRNERVVGAYLDRVRARLVADGLAVRTMLVRGGDVRDRLVRSAVDESIDLVVLSAHGRGGRLDAPCGSVAAYLLAHAGIPLFMVREAGPRLPRRDEPHLRTAPLEPPSRAAP